MRLTEKEQARIDSLHKEVERSLRRRVSEAEKAGDRSVLEKGSETVCRMVGVLKETRAASGNKGRGSGKASGSGRAPGSKAASTGKKPVRKSTLPKKDPCADVTTVSKLIGCLDRCCSKRNK